MAMRRGGGELQRALWQCRQSRGVKEREWKRIRKRKRKGKGNVQQREHTRRRPEKGRDRENENENKNRREIVSENASTGQQKKKKGN